MYAAWRVFFLVAVLFLPHNIFASEKVIWLPSTDSCPVRLSSLLLHGSHLSAEGSFRIISTISSFPFSPKVAIEPGIRSRALISHSADLGGVARYRRLTLFEPASKYSFSLDMPDTIRDFVMTEFRRTRRGFEEFGPRALVAEGSRLRIFDFEKGAGTERKLFENGAQIYSIANGHYTYERNLAEGRGELVALGTPSGIRTVRLPSLDSGRAASQLAFAPTQYPAYKVAIRGEVLLALSGGWLHSFAISQSKIRPMGKINLSYARAFPSGLAISTEDGITSERMLAMVGLGTKILGFQILEDGFVSVGDIDLGEAVESVAFSGQPGILLASTLNGSLISVAIGDLKKMKILSRKTATSVGDGFGDIFELRIAILRRLEQGGNPGPALKLLAQPSLPYRDLVAYEFLDVSRQITDHIARLALVDNRAFKLAVESLKALMDPQLKSPVPNPRQMLAIWFREGHRMPRASADNILRALAQATENNPKSSVLKEILFSFKLSEWVDGALYRFEPLAGGANQAILNYEMMLTACDGPANPRWVRD